MKAWIWLLPLGVACGGADDLEIGTYQQDHQRRWENYRASAVRETAFGYVVEGDIVFSREEDVRAYFDRAAGSDFGLTVHVADGEDDLLGIERLALTYCVGSGFPNGRKAEVVQAIQAAASSWNDFIGVYFTYVPSQDDACDLFAADVNFQVHFTAMAHLAWAPFPSAEGPDRILQISAAGLDPPYPNTDLEGILRHELGHILGFYHEHVWFEDPEGDRECDSDPPTDVYRAVTDDQINDPLSVMNHPVCRQPQTSFQRQSETDYQEARLLYGTSVLLIAAATSSLL